MEIPEAVVRYFQDAPLSEAERVAKMMALMVAGRRAEQAAQAAATQPARPARRHPVGKTKPDSIPALAEKVLRETNRPMSVSELLDGLRSRFNRTVAPTVMRSEMYKKSKPPHERFRRVGEGVFGLPEWGAELPLDQGSSSAQGGA